MNPAVLRSLPASACNLVARKQAPPHWIKTLRNTYDAAGQLTENPEGLRDTAARGLRDFHTYTSLNGKRAGLTDARGYRAEMTWDGHDRQRAGISRHHDDGRGIDDSIMNNMAMTPTATGRSLRKRDGSTITYQYDALNRNTVKMVPGRE